MVFIIEALPYIVFPGKVKEYMHYIERMPDKYLQIIGVALAFSGIVVIYLGRHLRGM